MQNIVNMTPQLDRRIAYMHNAQNKRVSTDRPLYTRVPSILPPDVAALTVLKSS